MKTQIIQLNSSDDYISVRDKMDWSQAKRILVVWPKHGHVLQRKLDLNLVKRHAVSLGAQLALVTRDAETRFFARQIDIPVFGNLHRAQNADWISTRPKEFTMQRNSDYAKLEKLRRDLRARTPAWLEHPLIRVLCLSLSVVALFSLAGFIFPGATITIAPQVENQSMVFDIIADPSTTMINYSSGSVPTYSLEAVVDGQDTISSSGMVIFPDKPAMGILRFSNISDHNVTIPAGTIVTTQGRNPIWFISTSNIDNVIKPNQSLILEAQAMKPGLSGNLPKNRLVVIEGILGSDLSVTNLAPTHGGTQKTVSSPSAQD
ncbi:MAG: baseplate J/gp47 family protein, partial [Anaerolineales bacterium]